MTAKKISPVSKILSYQIMLVIIVTIGFSICYEWQYGRSALLGGLAAFIPNAYLALRVQRTKNTDPRKIVNAFYVGEVVKLLLTVVMFFVIFQLANIVVLPLLIAYVTALSVFWFALLIR